MSKRIMIMAVIALLLLAAISQVYGAPTIMKTGGMELGQYKEMVKSLNLTPDQQTKIKDIMITGLKNAIELKKNLEFKEVDLKAAMLAENPDEAAVNKLIMESSELQGKIEVEQTDSRLRVKKLLTPEQRTKLEDYFWHKNQQMRETMMTNRLGHSQMKMKPGMKCMCPMMNATGSCPMMNQAAPKTKAAQTK